MKPSTEKNLSSIPLEMRDVICTYLPQSDLLSLALTDKACYYAASFRLRKDGVMKMYFTPDEEHPGGHLPTLVPWDTVQNAYMRIEIEYEIEDGTCKQVRYRPEQLASIYKLAGSTTLRKECQVLLESGIFATMPEPESFLWDALSTLTNCEQVVIRIAKGLNMYDRWKFWEHDIELVRRMLETSLGTPEYRRLRPVIHGATEMLFHPRRPRGEAKLRDDMDLPQLLYYSDGVLMIQLPLERAARVDQLLAQHPEDCMCDEDSCVLSEYRRTRPALIEPLS